MKSPSPLIFLIGGVALGGAGFFVIDRLVDPLADPGSGTLTDPGVATPVLGEEGAMAKLARLETENAGLRKELEAVAEGRPAGAETAQADTGDKPADNSMIEFMMEMGSEQAKRNIEPALQKIFERLDLTGDQEDLVRSALENKVKAQMAGGMLMMQGKAKLSDLINADQDNYAGFDAEMKGILSDEQWADYEAVRDEREFARIEKKTNQDLEGLKNIADLSPEESDRAFEILAELNAAENPALAPDDMTFDQFKGFMNEAIDNRLERLQPLLEGDEVTAYETQVGSFREMVVNMVGRATGNIAPDGTDASGGGE